MKCLLNLLLLMAFFGPGQSQPSEAIPRRPAKDYDVLQQINRINGKKVIQQVDEISPDLSDFILGHSCEEINPIGDLDLKSKELASIAVLMAIGSSNAQLKSHLNAAMDTRLNMAELKEVIVQTGTYAGLSATVNAMNIIRQLLMEREQKLTDEERPVDTASRLAKAERLKLDQLNSSRLGELNGISEQFPPQLIQLLMEFSYGDIYSGDYLDATYRQLASIAALAAMDSTPCQLKFHINLGLYAGLTVKSLKQVIFLVAIYAGFPAAIRGAIVLKEVIAEKHFTTS